MVRKFGKCMDVPRSTNKLANDGNKLLNDFRCQVCHVNIAISLKQHAFSKKTL